MTITIALLSADREAAYTRFVQSHSSSLISYTLRFRDLLIDLLGCRPTYGVALRNDEILGVLPIMALPGAFGTVLNSLPYFGSSGAPLAREAAASEALMDWFQIQAAAEGVAAATMIGNPLAVAPIRPHQLSDFRVAHITPLIGKGDPIARISSMIDSSARRNISKAQRSGTRVTIENDAFDELQRLHRASMALIGAQVKSDAFFEAVPRRFRAGVDYDLYMARINGAPAAALLIFYCAETVDYYMPAGAPEFRSSQPMAAVLIESMSEAARRGFTKWNWGGSWPTHESLQRFKGKWGGQPVEYGYSTNVRNAALLRAKKEQLMADYPGFYVVPFDSLEDD